MHQSKRWNIIGSDLSLASDLAGRLKASPIIAQLLLNRGLSETQACFDFLRPSLRSLHDPAAIPGLNKASERIARAIAEKKKIVVYGDYDVDGITATTILWHAIRRLGGVVDYYIPHRLEEGYGLNAEAIEQICRDGAGLIVSVDCGVTAIEPARVAQRCGVDLIITDHHEWREAEHHGTAEPAGAVLPECFAIVHPRLPGDWPAYPNPHLCGAGVAFKLAWGIGLACAGAAKCSEDFRNFLVEATALAALGTIADVVPLIGENRVLAHFGLGGLKASTLTGIRALIASANLTGQNLDSFHVGFLLAPRLNACGRMGHARLAVEMLTTADEPKANEIATFLEQQNRQRQAVEKKILDEALKQIETLDLAAPGKCAIVLGAEGWHPGVIGIVASRIVDRFHRPTLMIGLNNGIGQGSGRSIAGFHLAHALQACGDYLDGHGGHEMAAGLKMQADRFEEFRTAFTEYAGKVMRPELLVPELRIDCPAELKQITTTLVTDMARLGPFGHANRRPLLVCQNVTLASTPKRVGKTGDHLQLLVRQGDQTMKCIAFNFAQHLDRLKQGTALNLAVEPSINEYNGWVNVELEVKDIQPA